MTGGKTLGFLCHNFQGCRADVKSTTLSTMVRPTLEYAETVWDPYLQTQTQMLESVQRSFLRAIIMKEHQAV